MKTNMTTLCYIEKDGAYLMLHRTKKQNDENGGKWIGVGGHFEEGESPLAPNHGLPGNQNAEAPLGTGIAVLMGLGAAYLIGKKRNEE